MKIRLEADIEIPQAILEEEGMTEAGFVESLREMENSINEQCPPGVVASLRVSVNENEAISIQLKGAHE